jgi:hypothetical protein
MHLPDALLALICAFFSFPDRMGVLARLSHRFVEILMHPSSISLEQEVFVKCVADLRFLPSPLKALILNQFPEHAHS